MPKKPNYTINTDKEPTKFIIYKVTNLVNEKIYIGQTTKTMSNRMSGHLYSARKNPKQPFLHAINKYGVDNFKWEIIDYATSHQELDEKEAYYIKFCDSQIMNGKGYNIKHGGNQSRGYKMPPEQVEKQRQIMKQHYIDHPEKLIEMSIRMKEVNRLDPELRVRNSLAKKKYFLEHPEAKENISKRTTTYFKDLHNKKEFDLIMGAKPFRVFNIYTKELIGEWLSVMQCARDLELHETSIRECLKKNRSYHKKMAFIYLDDEDQTIPDAKPKRYFYVYKLYTKEFVGSWHSNTQCAKALGINKENVTASLNKRIRYCSGYYFTYDNENVEEKIDAIVNCVFPSSERFFVYKKDGTFITESQNQADCMLKLNIPHAQINACLKGKRSSSYGYYFIYADKDVESELLRLQVNHRKAPKTKGKFNVYTIDGEFVSSFYNKSECARQLNLTSDGISKCLNKKQAFHRGYVFKYVKADLDANK